MGADVNNPNLTTCGDCNGVVSINAASCPHCGCAFEAPKKKAKPKISWWAVGVGLILFSVYLNDQAEKSEAEYAASAPTPIPQPVTMGYSTPTGAEVAAAETRIPRNDPGDKGQYFLIESSRSGDVVTTVHKRVGPAGTGFTRTEINCKTLMIRDLAYGEPTLDAMKPLESSWYELVPGSSKSDVATFVC